MKSSEKLAEEEWEMYIIAAIKILAKRSPLMNSFPSQETIFFIETSFL
jgi:hypothetical protein